LRADIDGIVETKLLTNYGSGSLKAVASIERDGFTKAEILDQYSQVILGWSRGRVIHESIKPIMAN
jgi:hypothetical protein